MNTQLLRSWTQIEMLRHSKSVMHNVLQYAYKLCYENEQSFTQRGSPYMSRLLPETSLLHLNHYSPKYRVYTDIEEALK